MTGRFEWHITVAVEHREVVKRTAETFGFVFSQITGCPILGQGEYCYVTGYDPDSERALAEMTSVATALIGENIPVLRAKIEDIVYDTKTQVNRLVPHES